jgi:lysophospholipase L1-like esterase
MLRIICFFLPLCSFAQIQWTSPQSVLPSSIQGKLITTPNYQRLPEEMMEKVRPPLWNLSLHSSGLFIRFSSNAPQIYVRYHPKQEIQMPHMPATGVSGLDLYMLDDQNIWEWVRGNYTFSPLVSYSYSIDNKSSLFHEFLLFLPLYQQIENLKIGIPDTSVLKLNLPSEKLPLIIYGTSIAQGACASRPGMAWTSILHRNLNIPVINLGFSGNGLLESEIVELMGRNKAQFFIIDCLPNLGPEKGLDTIEIKKRIIQTVQILKNHQLEVPILFASHPGYSDGWVNSSRANVSIQLNSLLYETIQELQNKGRTDLYILSKDDIGLTSDDYVDGTHPNDKGMEKYAQAYLKKIKEIQNAKD